MMVVMTSWAPVRALRNPGMNPQKAPVTIPTAIDASRITKAGTWPWSTNAVIVAPRAPIISWPSTPMLNMPARNEMATASPARISGVEATSVSVSGRMAVAMSAASPVSSAVRIRTGSPNAPRASPRSR